MRYIGSKQALSKSIVQAIGNQALVNGTVADLFAGTGAVARELKRVGFAVTAADLLVFPFVLQRAYIQLNECPSFSRLLPHLWAQHPRQGTLFLPSDAMRHEANTAKVIEHLNSLPGYEGFIFRNYTPEGTEGKQFVRSYFRGENGKQIDAVFHQIREWCRHSLLSEDEYYFLLASALEAVPLVANTLGTFGAFKKGPWEVRAVKPYCLNAPRLITSHRTNRAIHGAANDVVNDIVCDVLYLDPPYNNRQYAEYYHLLESLAEGSEPEIGGVTGKPLGLRRLSRYCTRPGAREQLTELIAHAQTRHIFLSYSDDGLLTSEEIAEILSQRGTPSQPLMLAEHRRYRSDRDREAEGDRKRKYKENRTVKEWLYHVSVTR